MTSQWQLNIDDAEPPTETSRRLERVASAIAILAALTFVDATPQMILDSAPGERLRSERTMPSACGAEAVARAQREVLGIRPPNPVATA